ASQHTHLRRPPNAISNEKFEQILRRFDRLSVELQQDITHKKPGSIGRTSRLDRHNHDAVFRYILAALAFGEAHRLSSDAEVGALRAAMLQNAGRRLPG